MFDPSKVRASGPGLERGKAGEAATFTVDCSEAGEAELTIEILSDAGVKAEVLIQNNADGTYHITYSPAFPGTYTITIKYGGHPIPKFPTRVHVQPAVDTSGIKVSGPGVEPHGKREEQHSAGVTGLGLEGGRGAGGMGRWRFQGLNTPQGDQRGSKRACRLVSALVTKWHLPLGTFLVRSSNSSV